MQCYNLTTRFSANKQRFHTLLCVAIATAHLSYHFYAKRVKLGCNQNISS